METLEDIRKAIMADSQNQAYTKRGIDYDTFYHSGYFAAIPMDFYFPGHGKSGDLPPRKGFAEKWHQQILELLPDLELTILIGQYAQKYYLHQKGTVKLTDTVKHYQDYLPEYFPLVHPSPRNQIWLAKNPWFADLQAKVQQIISR